ncbi:MAG: FAD-dependent oxidoreductase, partial [Raoultibacter sp.]
DSASNSEATKDISGDASAHEATVVAGENVRYAVPQRIALGTLKDESITLSFRVTRTLRKPRFFVEGIDEDGAVHAIKTAKTMVAVPAEMVQIKLRGGDTMSYPIIRVRAEGHDDAEVRISEPSISVRGSRDSEGGGAN